MQGFIYVFRCEKYYKIGKTTRDDVQHRLKECQTGSPFEIVIHHVIYVDDATLAEGYLHRRLAKQRVRGEWFRLTEKQLEWLCELRDIDAAFLNLYDPVTRLARSYTPLSSRERAQRVSSARRQIPPPKRSGPPAPITPIRPDVVLK